MSPDRQNLETPARIEPCLFEDQVPRRLADLAVELQAAAGALGRGLHPDTAAELAEMVRVLNCYYSNLIEGHNEFYQKMPPEFSQVDHDGRVIPVVPGQFRQRPEED